MGVSSVLYICIATHTDIQTSITPGVLVETLCFLYLMPEEMDT